MNMVLIKPLLLSLMLPMAFRGGQANNDFVKLIIDVDNIRHTDGQPMRFGICKKDDFLTSKTPFVYAIVEVRNAKITQTFSLPKGEYAVSIYHDLNRNDKLDKNIFGAPTEPYGFSRNFTPLVRAPKFDEVKINLAQDKKISISLIH
jgi:uncharacterized protein (DUF2141 family)